MPHLPDHATHDPELIAAYAAGDAAGASLADATELVAGCAECAELHRDLRAIAVALPTLPVPVRPRDFRLTPEQAASLAPSGWRGVLAAFASPRFRLAAPLGTGLAAIGLAGLLLASPGTLLPSGDGAATTAESAASTPAAAAGGPPAAGGGPAAAPLAPVPSIGAGEVDGSGDTGYMPREPFPGTGSGASAAASMAAAAGLADAGTTPAASAGVNAAGPATSPAPASSVERELATQAPPSAPAAEFGAVPASPPDEPARSPWLAVSVAFLIVGATLVILRLAARSGARA